jgi:exopolysaccharide biosynthesis protein
LLGATSEGSSIAFQYSNNSIANGSGSFTMVSGEIMMFALDMDNGALYSENKVLGKIVATQQAVLQKLEHLLYGHLLMIKCITCTSSVSKQSNFYKLWWLF